MDELVTACDRLHQLLGTWEQRVDLPGAENAIGLVVFEAFGAHVLERSTVPDTVVPDSTSIMATQPDGSLVQHYFDTRGVARLYDMTFDGITWTLTRTKADFWPLEFCQRYVGRLIDDGNTIAGVWQTSPDGEVWKRDFGITYRRVSATTADL